MRTFNCDTCGQLLFFENNLCIRCKSSLGFAVDRMAIIALQPAQPNSSEAPLQRIYYPVFRKDAEDKRSYRLCKNAIQHSACNWLIDANSNAVFCRSCQLTDLLPPLADQQARSRWVQIEAAKRRLLYTLFSLGLPVRSRAQDNKTGLAFRFPQATPEHPVVTGHAMGVITLNIAEADGSFRENAREKLGEAYRTVLGHLRHEIGHYYWDLLVKNGPWLEEVRQHFGDDRKSYQQELDRHYRSGPPPQWNLRYISAYATMHPWEDWAETWAHYLHMLDTLQTASAYSLAINAPNSVGEQKRSHAAKVDPNNFDELYQSWYSLTFVLNGLSRSMGMPDTYPFAPSEAVRAKLELIHRIVTAESEAKPLSLTPAPPQVASSESTQSQTSDNVQSQVQNEPNSGENADASDGTRPN